MERRVSVTDSRKGNCAVLYVKWQEGSDTAYVDFMRVYWSREYKHWSSITTRRIENFPLAWALEKIDACRKAGHQVAEETSDEATKRAMDAMVF